MVRVLHVLSQRPGRTGSGTTLDALVRQADAAGWDQHAVVGVPVDDREFEVGELPAERIHELRFGTEELPFAVPGMSDVMPYPSTRWSEMTAGQLGQYREVFGAHLRRVIDEVRPDVIHSHHLWLVTSMVAEIAGEIPVIAHCHATGLRQMGLCPHLAPDIQRGLGALQRIVVLHEGQARAVVDALGVDEERVVVVGAGYRDELFHSRGDGDPGHADLLYVGKLSSAKGLPWLLDAFERLAAERPELRLHVVGAGAGEESVGMRERMRNMPRVEAHGALPPSQLAEVMRACSLSILPSFHEGLPLVLVEAAACGCRLVATELEPVRDVLAPVLGDGLITVPMPRLDDVGAPVEVDLPAFVDDLEGAMREALRRGSLDASAEALDAFTWSAVFDRVQALWRNA